MPITLLSATDFSKIPSLQFVVPVVSADPTGYEAGLIYNSTTKELKYHNGTAWVALGASGSGGPPSGAAGGDLSGTYPNPAIKADVIVDADVNTAAAIAQSKIANLVTDLANRALKTTQVVAGAGLSGGGAIDANRSIDIGAGSGIIVAADSISVDTPTLDLRYQVKSEKGAASGYAPLDSASLIPTVHLPPLAISDVFVVADQASMLALNAQVGDMAIRTDVNKTFVLSASPASTLANWKEVMATGQVVSVNGQTGVVSITLASLGGVATSRQVIAGAGLTGGGDLSADRTINVVGGATLSVGADQVDVVSAPKWTTARTITLGTDLTGNVSLDGSGNVTLNATVSTVGGGAWPIVKKSTFNVPAGASCVINHGMITTDVMVQVFRVSAPGDTIQCDVERTDANNVTLKFATAVAANAFRCVVIG